MKNFLIAIAALIVIEEGLVQGGATMAFEIKSSAFTNEGNIPKPHTCEGADRSPALSWSGAPAATKSFALICDDPDAPMGTWVHWVIYNIPSQTTLLTEGMPTDPRLKNGSLQGINDFKKSGYGGPCPPQGHGPHRYYFKLYALDGSLSLSPGATKSQLESAMKGHILAQATLMGRYERK